MNGHSCKQMAIGGGDLKATIDRDGVMVRVLYEPSCPQLQKVAIRAGLVKA